MFPALVLPAIISVLVAFALSAAEAALFRMSKVRAEELFEEGRSGAKSLLTVIGEPKSYLAVLAFLRVVAEATCAVLLTLAVRNWLSGTWQVALVSIGLMALVSFIVVGISPRTLGLQNYDTVALWSAPLTVGLRRLLGPVARLLVVLGNAVAPGQGYAGGPFQTESELRDLVDKAEESSLIEEDEADMIQSVFDLGDTVVREVMVPRTDMLTIEQDKSLRSAQSLFLRSGFSRIPVVGEDSDDVRGLLYFKDVARRLSAAPSDGKTLAAEVMRPMAFVPESKPVDDLLREMQRDQSHFAIVVDEYGGTAGLVTIEDIIEEIVGEIDDEHDRDSPKVQDLDDGTYRVPAGLHVDDLAEYLDLEFEEDDVDTVGGLLTKAIGRVPIVGSVGEAHGLELTAERMSGRRHRVGTVIVRRLQAPDEQTEEEHRE